MVCTPVGNYFQARDAAIAYASASGITTAVRWLWAAILAACGITVNDELSLDSIANGVSQWVDSLTDDVAKAKYKLLLESMQKASWGVEINAAYEIVQMVKLYLKTNDGYGTDTGITSIPIYESAYKNSYSYRYSVDPASVHSSLSFDNYVFSANPDSGSRFFDYFYTNDYVRMAAFKSSYYIYVYIIDSAGDIKSCKLSYIFYRTEFDEPLYGSADNAGFLNGVNYDTTKHVPIPIFDTSDGMRSYLKTGVIGETINKYTGTAIEDTPVDSIPAVQARPIQQAGALRVPATMEEAYAQYVDFTKATTPDEVVAALNPSWEITYGPDVTTGEDDKTYPWVPDITGPLGAIKDVINGIGTSLTDIKGWIMDIPQKLTDIKDGILSIPKQITDFFTIDTAVISASFTDLLDTFQGRFSGLNQLASVFSYNGQTFSETPPIFKMKTPDALKFDGVGDEIVVLDLTPFATQLHWCRLLLIAMLWVLFAHWLLNQFDTKFHVG